MRHLLLAVTMLAAALVVTFGVASALEGAAVAQDNGSRDDQYQVTEIAKPTMQSTGTNERVTSLFR
jgi:hypothetical protein